MSSPGIQPAQVEVPRHGQAGAALRYLGPEPIAHSGTQRYQGAGPAIGGGAATDPHNDLGHPEVEGSRDQLPDTVGGGPGGCDR